MSLPNTLTIKINTKEHNDNKLHEIIISNAAITTKAYSTDFRKALLNAIDFFEVEYTKSLIT